MSLVVGDLVEFKRRVEPGLGIVVKIVKDVDDETNVNLTGMFKNLMNCIRESTAKNENFPEYYGSWQRIEECRTRLKNMVSDDDVKALIEAYFHYNISFPTKEKNEFCLVTWFKSPSEYGAKIRQDRIWVPIEWLKVKKEGKK